MGGVGGANGTDAFKCVDLGILSASSVVRRRRLTAIVTTQLVPVKKVQTLALISWPHTTAWPIEWLQQVPSFGLSYDDSCPLILEPS
mmetsp:Transcript_32018/g.63919  ORF Transcript_32018/g.63919 Transcript_32018/m.63919 type:complete len:87 (+) Transcript_32018:518-778(+)